MASAGELECEGQLNKKSINFFLPDFSDVPKIAVNGKTKEYPLTTASSRVTRYKLPYVLISNAHETFQLTVFRTGANRDLRANLTFGYASTLSKTVKMKCVYHVTE